VKLVVAVRLFPAAAHEAALRDTLALCNRAANMVSARAFQDRVTAKQPLQRLVYGRVGPGAPGRQMVPVCDLRRPRP
jgi:putative transposase